MATEFYVKCREYELGPFKSLEAAERSKEYVELVNVRFPGMGCKEEHEIIERKKVKTKNPKVLA